jgi:hypothetical protein
VDVVEVVVVVYLVAVLEGVQEEVVLVVDFHEVVVLDVYVVVVEVVVVVVFVVVVEVVEEEVVLVMDVI